MSNICQLHITIIEKSTQSNLLPLFECQYTFKYVLVGKESFHLKCKLSKWSLAEWALIYYFTPFFIKIISPSDLTSTVSSCAGGGICEETVGVEMYYGSSMLWALEWRHSGAHCVLVLFSQLLHRASQRLQHSQGPAWFWTDITACFLRFSSHSGSLLMPANTFRGAIV